MPKGNHFIKNLNGNITQFGILVGYKYVLECTTEIQRRERRSYKEGKMARKKADDKTCTAASKPRRANHPSIKSGHKSKNAKAQGAHEGTPPEVLRREKIALLAYSYWEQRGCQGGTPEEDWYRAEREMDFVS